MLDATRLTVIFFRGGYPQAGSPEVGTLKPFLACNTSTEIKADAHSTLAHLPVCPLALIDPGIPACNLLDILLPACNLLGQLERPALRLQ